MSDTTQAAELRVARRRLAVDSIGIWVLAIVIGTIFGFTAREGGLSLVEAAAFSSILFAGAAQFAAVGLLAVAAPWGSHCAARLAVERTPLPLRRIYRATHNAPATQSARWARLFAD